MEKCRRLGIELSHALNDYADQRFHALVYPSDRRGKWSVGFVCSDPSFGPMSLPIEIEKMTPKDQIDCHLSQAAKVMKSVNGGNYWIALDEDMKTASLAPMNLKGVWA